jgi:hypothetical protein
MMSDPPDLASIVGIAAQRRGLRARADLHEPGWAFWELRNINMHRVVGLLRAYRTFADVADIESEVRAAIARDFKRAWWRGLAYGVVVAVEPTSWTPDDLKLLVDVREDSRGVLQWAIVVTPDGRHAIGAHTWELAFLSPVYREILDGLRANGAQVDTAVKGKDGLMQVLTSVSRFGHPWFPEYHDEPRDSTSSQPSPP